MTLRILTGIKQLRFILCQNSAHSENLRCYITNNYEAIRQSSAKISIRQCKDSYPMVLATYKFGIEQRVSLKKLSISEIDKKINELEAQSEQIVSQVKI